MEGRNKKKRKSIRNKQKGGIVEKGRKVQGKEHRREGENECMYWLQFPLEQLGENFDDD